jgi:hypothetical protein
MLDPLIAIFVPFHSAFQIDRQHKEELGKDFQTTNKRRALGEPAPSDEPENPASPREPDMPSNSAPALEREMKNSAPPREDLGRLPDGPHMSPGDQEMLEITRRNGESNTVKV